MVDFLLIGPRTFVIMTVFREFPLHFLTSGAGDSLRLSVLLMVVVEEWICFVPGWMERVNLQGY